MFDRKVLAKIIPFLDTHDILLFYGARQVGKTSLMKIIKERYFTNNAIFLDLENIEYLQLCNQNPNIFISYLQSYYNWDASKKITIFIDEIQYLDNPTQFLKYIYDNFPAIKLIISGSSTLEIRGKLHDSLVGRMIKFDILPLSFGEFLTFKGKENLSGLIGSPIELGIINNEMLFYYQEFMTYGGYPKIVLSNNIVLKQEYLKQIYSTYIEKDIKDIGKIREVDKFNKTLQILAQQVGSLLNISELSNTVGVQMQTLQEWLFLLENTFVIKIIKPYSTNIRGELTKMPKLFFVDNGIRNSILRNYSSTGESFENSFFNMVYNSYRNTSINFYRTQDKKEIDFVLDGLPCELKLSYNGKSLTSLNYFQEKYGKLGTVVTLEKKSSAFYSVLYPWEL